MSTFALRRIEAVSGRQVFYMLLVDGAAQMDEFANNRTLPVAKFRDITPKRAKV